MQRGRLEEPERDLGKRQPATRSPTAASRFAASLCAGPSCACGKPVSQSGGKLACACGTLGPVSADAPHEDHRVLWESARSLEASRLQEVQRSQRRPGRRAKGSNEQTAAERPWLCYQSRSDPDSM